MTKPRRVAPPKLAADDYPSIGERRGGWTFACVGEDRPDQWLDWLEDCVLQVERLIEATGNVAKFQNPKTGHTIDSWYSFCEAIGVNFDTTFIDREVASGFGHLGWIRTRALAKAERHARMLVERFEKQLAPHLLEEALDHVCEDCSGTIASFEEEQRESAARLKDLEARLAAAIASNTTALDRACLDLVCRAWGGEAGPALAGPLVLWTDRKVYALVRIGDVELPLDSSPARTLRGLEAAGFPVVRLHEQTDYGSHRGRLFMRQGPDRLLDWLDVWKNKDKLTCPGAAPADAAQVEAIRRHFREKPADDGRGQGGIRSPV